MKITFTDDCTYKCGETAKDWQFFKKGETHDLRDDLAERWTRRQKAVVAKEDVKATAPVTAPKTKTYFGRPAVTTEE